MEKEAINLGRGKIGYVTYSNESEKNDFKNIQVREGPAAAYRWWLRRHQQPKPSPQPTLPFEEKLKERLNDHL